MEIFKEFLCGIADLEQRIRMEEILNWVSEKFPVLEPRVAWNQPIHYSLLEKIIIFNMENKADCSTFWRK